MRIKLTLITVLMLLVNIVASDLPKGIQLIKTGKGYTVNFSLSGYSLSDLKANDQTFTKINVEDYGITNVVGMAQLPAISFNVMIQNDEQVPSVDVINVNTNEVKLTNKIYPTQAPWEKTRSLSDRPFNISPEYSKGLSLPFVTISDPFYIGGVKGVRVTIHPFAYNASKDLLTVTQNGTFLLVQNNSFNLEARPEAINDYLNSVYVNYSNTNTKTLSNYLIITAPEFEAGLAPFVTHKSGKGYNVTVVNTNTTGISTTAIKTYIQTQYNNPSTKPEYILLVGDINKIPQWTGSGEGNPPTDLNYACLAGSDNFADVFLGRFSITSAAELTNAINKSIYMENNIGALSKKSIFMASTDNYSITEGTHNFVIDSFFQPNNYTFQKLYTQTYNATTAQLIAALNANQTFAIYSGHGATTYWADGPVLNQSEVRALTNTVFPFVYSFACVTGEYTAAECFGETWLRTTTGGATFYGSSVNSYWDEDDILERRLIRAMFTDGLTKVTPMMDKAKIYLVNHFGSVTATMLRYLEMYNLMGDPSMPTVKQLTPDTVAPARITNLTTTDQTSNSITVSWTAPLDTTFGGVAGYDIRYSTSAITNDQQFNAAPSKLLLGCSDTLGTPKAFTVDGLAFNTTYYFAVKAKDMWGNTSIISNGATSHTYNCPMIAVAPDSLQMNVMVNTNAVDTIKILNNSCSVSTLDWTAQLVNNTFPDAFQLKVIPAETIEETDRNGNKDESIVSQKGGNIKGQGGPDQYGYKWKDSDAPNGPAYVWNSIESTGTEVTTWIPSGTGTAADDGYVGPINLGFNFKYYGETKTQIYITTNGLLTFVPVSETWYTNDNIPETDAPNSILAPFWDDLDGRTQGKVHYKQAGNKFIIQFTNWQKYNTTSSLTFQIVLSSNGKINYYYNTMTGTLNSATVGIESNSGTDGLPVAYNSTYIKNNLAVEFAAEPEWLAVDRVAGRIYNGNAAKVVVSVNAQGLDLGDYRMEMKVASNDTTKPVVTVPIRMHVSENTPVELTALTAAKLNNQVIINWETKTELNNKGFEVEKKVNGSFVSVGFVNGKGTTTSPTNYSFTDNVKENGTLVYRLKQIDFNGAFEYSKEVEVKGVLPEKFDLSQNYPNPFNPTTKINYQLPNKSFVELYVVDILGNKVTTLVNQELEAGYYDVEFSGSGLSSGVYFYVIKAGNFTSVKKLMLLK